MAPGPPYQCEFLDRRSPPPTKKNSTPRSTCTNNNNRCTPKPPPFPTKTTTNNSVAGGFNNRATGRFAAVPGGSSNIASGRHSAALGSFGTAKFDYSVVINGLGTPCAAESASEVRLCGNSLLFETPTGEVVDLLAGVARRSLSERAKEAEERRQTAAVIEALQAETAALRRQVDALVAAAAGAA
jgi:hypothetical protein